LNLLLNSYDLFSAIYQIVKHSGRLFLEIHIVYFLEIQIFQIVSDISQISIKISSSCSTKRTICWSI